MTVSREQKVSSPTTKSLIKMGLTQSRILNMTNETAEPSSSAAVQAGLSTAAAEEVVTLVSPSSPEEEHPAPTWTWPS
ncbi:hypothetical protein SKAU_G00026440 [Synaphobranchus kaupii]|uniref:Uncharacterized protein n=1 Tax=Synaphobranchus kaupii TaxID=118154 RepID=A0A9Q1JCQ2_SYNKA|nr:hypothetical protein SKAU_G00026440 [Synaphobranchus kaupii]